MPEKTLNEMLEEIQDEAKHRDGDVEWIIGIVDTYNHLFGTDYNFVDFLPGD